MRDGITTPSSAVLRERDATSLEPPSETNSHGSTRWNEGLEFARASAIALVVYSHGLILLKRSPTWHFFNETSGFDSFFKPGWWGVRIFFALSGYLISRQVIQVLSQGQARSAIFFTLRRWIRTVPTYWLFLAFACSWKGINWFSAIATQNALFIQTASPSGHSLIEVAWSLVIEEWSYALMAALVILSALAGLAPSLKQAARLILAIALFSCCLSVALRVNASGEGWISWDTLKKTATLQLDSLAFGTILAGCEILRPRLFHQFTHMPRLMGAISILGMSCVGLWLNHTFNVFSKPTQLDWILLGSIGYTISSILSCCFLGWLWTLRLSDYPDWAAKALRLVSNTSYSLYLVHLSIASTIASLWPEMNGLLAFSLYAASSILAGWICWIFLEKPFLSLRRYLRA